jgi:hypothetical protein
MTPLVESFAARAGNGRRMRNRRQGNAVSLQVDDLFALVGLRGQTFWIGSLILLKTS